MTTDSDLLCGLASVFLAREFDLQVWAGDLWIQADGNDHRFREAGLGDRVFPLHIGARSLPFAESFFDAIVCVDACIYFGKDDPAIQTDIEVLEHDQGR